jgi:hypothetical protein
MRGNVPACTPVCFPRVNGGAGGDGMRMRARVHVSMEVRIHACTHAACMLGTDGRNIDTADEGQDNQC